MTKTILVIDDDQYHSDLYKKALGKRGYTVRHCRRLAEALEYLEEKTAPVDLMMLDIMMPPASPLRPEETRHGLITGVLLYPELRKLRPKVPVIVLTNLAVPKILDQLPTQDQALRGVLHKLDYDPLQLADAVAAVLEGREPPAPEE